MRTHLLTNGDGYGDGDGDGYGDGYESGYGSGDGDGDGQSPANPAPAEYHITLGETMRDDAVLALCNPYGLQRKEV